MKKLKIIAAMLAAVLSFAALSGCAAKMPEKAPEQLPQTESETATNPDPAKESTSAGTTEPEQPIQTENKSETPASKAPSEKESSDPSAQPTMELNRFLVYVQKLACYFSEPVSSGAELCQKPGFYEYLLNSAPWIHREKGRTLKNQWEYEWDPTYELPRADAQTLARALLGMEGELPQNWPTEETFGYQEDLDAFVFEPSSPYTMESYDLDYSINADGTADVVVRVSPMKQKTAVYNCYHFKTVDDPDWGKVYQLTSIERLAGSPLGDFADGEFIDFFRQFVSYFELTVSSQKDILQNPLTGAYLLERTYNLGGGFEGWPKNEVLNGLVPKEAIQQTALRELGIENYDCEGLEEWAVGPLTNGAYPYTNARCSPVAYRAKLQKLSVAQNEVKVQVYLQDSTDSPVLGGGMMRPADRLLYRFEILPNGEGWRLLGIERI